MEQQLVYLGYRETPATEGELGRASELTQGYWRDYPQNDRFSGPETYLEDDGPIYAGSLQIPQNVTDDERSAFFEYWLTWLTDITRTFSGSHWKVELDGAPLVWDEEMGWSLYAR